MSGWRVSVELAERERLTLFAKRLAALEVDHPDKQLANREALVYWHLLDGERGLPVPRHYGHAGDVLWLSWVDGLDLRYHDVDRWFTAAARLGELHASFAARPQQLLDSTFLLQLDRTYLEGWSGRAVEIAEGRSSPLGRDLERAVEALDSVARELRSPLPTLVHNDLAPKNVLVGAGTDEAAISIVDWELAGRGCGLLDLAHLSYGLAPEDATGMLAAYREGIGRSAALPANETAIQRLKAASEWQKTIYRIARADAWAVPTERVAEWVADLRRARSLL